MIEVDKLTFAGEVLSVKGLIVVDFWSPKCKECKGLMPSITELSKKYTGKAKFCKLDTLSNMEVAISQRVIGLPTIIFYRDGKKVVEFCKDIDVEDVEARLQELI